MLAGQHEKRPGEDLSKRCPSASLGSLLPLPLKPQYSGTLPAHLPGLPSGSGSRASTAFALPTDSVNNPGQHGFGLAQTVPDDGQPRQESTQALQGGATTGMDQSTVLGPATDMDAQWHAHQWQIQQQQQQQSQQPGSMPMQPTGPPSSHSPSPVSWPPQANVAPQPQLQQHGPILPARLPQVSEAMLQRQRQQQQQQYLQAPQRLSQDADLQLASAQQHTMGQGTVTLGYAWSEPQVRSRVSSHSPTGDPLPFAPAVSSEVEQPSHPQWLPQQSQIQQRVDPPMHALHQHQHPQSPPQDPQDMELLHQLHQQQLLHRQLGALHDRAFSPAAEGAPPADGSSPLDGSSPDQRPASSQLLQQWLDEDDDSQEEQQQHQHQQQAVQPQDVVAGLQPGWVVPGEEGVQLQLPQGVSAFQYQQQLQQMQQMQQLQLGVGPDRPTPVAMPTFHPTRSVTHTANPKLRLRWTPELHSLFLQAVEALGGPEQATPKGIMVRMGVPQLSIFHVKSHLQKIRLNERPANEKGARARARSGSRRARSASRAGSHRAEPAEEVEEDFLDSMKQSKAGRGDRLKARKSAAQRQSAVEEAVSRQMDMQKQLQLQLLAQWQMQQNLDQHAKYIDSLLAKEATEAGTGDTGSEEGDGGGGGGPPGGGAAGGASPSRRAGNPAAWQLAGCSGGTSSGRQHRLSTQLPSPLDQAAFVLLPQPTAPGTPQHMGSLRKARSMQAEQLMRSDSPAQYMQRATSLIHDATTAPFPPVGSQEHMPVEGAEPMHEAVLPPPLPPPSRPPPHSSSPAVAAAQVDPFLEMHQPLPTPPLQPPLDAPPFPFLPPVSAPEAMQLDGSSAEEALPGGSPGDHLLAGSSPPPAGAVLGEAPPVDLDHLEDPLFGHHGAINALDPSCDWLWSPPGTDAGSRAGPQPRMEPRPTGYATSQDE